MRNEMIDMRDIMVTALELFSQTMNKGKMDLQDSILIKASADVNSGIAKEIQMMKNKEIQKIVGSDHVSLGTTKRIFEKRNNETNKEITNSS